MNPNLRGLIVLAVTLPGALAVAHSATAQTAEPPAAIADDYLVWDSVVPHGDASNHLRIYGKAADEGEYVAIVPSLGRGVEDYTERYNSTLTTRLVEAGYRVVLIQPRGIGKSTGDLTPANASMSMFAKDLKLTLDAAGINKVNLVGHAWGNRLVRTFTTLYPDYVDDLALLAAGGADEKNEQQIGCLSKSFNLRLSDADRIEALGCAFFAKGNDPSVWLNGWYPELAQAEMLAARMIDGEFFKNAGGKPFLVIQAAEDFISPPETAGRPLKTYLGNQVTYVEIPRAGHALTSEQPDRVAQELVKYFTR